MWKFAVIGHPVAHSLSPMMHLANLSALAADGSYEKVDVAPTELKSALCRFRAQGYLGLNVTIPYKQAVVELLDRADESVAECGACNTLKFESDGSVTGSNTDVVGFVETLSAHGFSLRGKRVMIVGCGGAGVALAAWARNEGACQVGLAGRSADKVRAAVAQARISSRDAGAVGFALGAPECLTAAAEADLVVNATPLGLNPGDESPLPESVFHAGQLVLDLVPTVDLPPMARVAAGAGAEIADGLEFLVAQGAKSFELWTGHVADRAVMTAAVRGVEFIYGPPASGKTTFGQRLAEKRGAAFVDLDAAIVSREGRTIPEIFAAVGEAGFREAESAALTAVLAAVNRRTVVALGGGALLRPVNRRRCEAAGPVYCLAAPSAAELTRRLALAPGSRPLGDRSTERAEHYASFDRQCPVL